MGISEDRKKQRRKEILKAAADLFANNGFEGTSFNEIAVKARASKETLYAWFGSKTEILHALLSERADTVRGTVEAEAKSGEPEEVLFVFAREVLREIAKKTSLRLLNAAITAAPKDGDLRDLVADRIDMSLLAARLALWRAMGLMAFEDANRTAMVFAAMVQGGYPVLLTAGLIETIPDEEIETHARFVTKMFLKAVERPARK